MVLIPGREIGVNITVLPGNRVLVQSRILRLQNNDDDRELTEMNSK